MENYLEQTINFYCNNQLKTFQESHDYAEMKSLAGELNLKVVCSYGYAENDFKQVYLSFQVKDEFGNTVVVDNLDFEHLTDAAIIVKIDRKKRLQFLSWENDDEFIDSVKWTIKKLREFLVYRKKR